MRRLNPDTIDWDRVVWMFKQQSWSVPIFDYLKAVERQAPQQYRKLYEELYGPLRRASQEQMVMRSAVIAGITMALLTARPAAQVQWQNSAPREVDLTLTVRLCGREYVRRIDVTKMDEAISQRGSAVYQWVQQLIDDLEGWNDD